MVKWWDLDTQHCFKTVVGHRTEVPVGSWAQGKNEKAQRKRWFLLCPFRGSLFLLPTIIVMYCLEREVGVMEEMLTTGADSAALKLGKNWPWISLPFHHFYFLSF